jgi:molybdopterin synthase sulfur carrier subunit
MDIEIVSFGHIAEFISNQRITIAGIDDTDQLRAYLESAFPLLAETKYKLALNKRMIQGKSPITQNDIVAIMPPFSGG